ncbi:MULTISPECIES: hypothetical protein [unclassified Asaia]|uniref:hypothetical protein n=1 Tax=unclassified Asaia TaxID=2685023 RepID=UPI0018F68735|nr:hypothetical protein [Asaia sp. W19]
MFYPRGVFAGLIAISLLCPCTVYGWGERAHGVINRAAIDALPDDGPVYLKAQEALIARSATLPDTWRAESEAFSKMEEDPNHGWFREQFAFITTIPRSRIAFLLSLYREHERLARSDPGTAQRMNIRWTGTLPYAVLEGYGRLVADMRLIRALRLKGVDTTPFETDTAFLVAWMGHYIADGSQPLHVTVHHDGWVGPNPAHYTRDPAVHGRFETDYVNLIGLSESDIVPYLAPVAHQHSDVFTAVLAYLDRSHRDVETVYRLDRDGALHDAGNREARSLVYERCAAASAMLRDLVTRAWKESGLSPLPPTHPDDPDNPGYDPATGSAPAPLSRKLPEPVRHAVP